MLNIAKSRFLSGKKIIFTLLIIHCSLIIANAQWVQMSNGMGNGYVFSFLSVGTNIFAGTDNGIYLSTNNGSIWSHITSNIYSVKSLAVSGDNIFAGSNTGIHRSTNNGTNWAPIGLSGGSILSLAVFGNNIFAGTDASGIFLSSNNGNNWIQTSVNYNYQGILSFFVSENYIFAGKGGNYPYSQAGIFRSNDNFYSWTFFDFQFESVFSIAGSVNNIFTGTDGIGVYISTNNGNNWVQTSLGSNYHVASLTVSGNYVFAGMFSNSGVYVSTNNGSNWIHKNQGFNPIPTVNALLIANNYIFAGTDGNGVWRSSLTEIIGIKNISSEIPSSYSLSQNFPNPFNPTTTIKFAVPKLSNVKISVNDITGKELEVLVNEQLQAGTYQTNWNASNFSSGVYFYRLQTEDFSDTKKLILLK
jgi:hypothetical protein